MKNPMDMEDEEYRQYQSRQRAASMYRHEGYNQFADEVERGERDDCSGVRIARFFIDPPPPLTIQFVEAWEAASGSRS